MKTNELARRYAAALFLVASERDNVKKVAEDIEAVKLMLETSKEVADFFTSPVFSPEVKVEMLKEPLAKQGLSEEVINLVLVAVRKGRLAHIPYIANAFVDLVDKQSGVTRGTVTSATELSNEDRAQLKEMVGKFINGEVVLNYEEDSSIIGGMVAEVGGWTFNDSIDSHLTRLNEDLKRSVH